MTNKEIQEILNLPFDPSEVKWKPQTKPKNGRVMAVAFVDARLVIDRLNWALGFNNWKDSYKILSNGVIECTLSVRLPGVFEWIDKVDVGGESDQPDGSDRMKSAYSDALKRAAVKLGIARDLYRLPVQWVDYDEAKNRITKVPSLPVWYTQKIKDAKAKYPHVFDPAPAEDELQPEAEPEAPKPKPVVEKKVEAPVPYTKTINDLLNRIGDPVVTQGFLGHFKVANISQISEAVAPKAIGMLEVKLKELGK